MHIYHTQAQNIYIIVHLKFLAVTELKILFIWYGLHSLNGVILHALELIEDPNVALSCVVNAIVTLGNLNVLALLKPHSCL